MEISVNFLCMYFIGRFSLFKSLYVLFLMSFSIYFFIIFIQMFMMSFENEEKITSVYSSLIKNIDETLMRINLNYTISYISKPFLGLEKEYLTTQCEKYPFFEMNLMKELFVKDVTTTWKWKDIQSNHYYQFKASLIKNNNKLDYLLIVVSDITDQAVRKDNEIRRITAETSLKSKIEFIASISHEIRNPLQAVNYSCENLLASKLTNDQSESVNDILNSNNLVSTIIGDILDMSRIEAGKMVVTQDKMNILDVLELSVDLNYNEARKKDLNLYLTFDVNLPLFIESDKMRLTQVLNNFLSNSIKYSTQGNIYLSCRSVSKNGEDFISFSCKDEGIGISKEDSKMIFTPFQQFITGTKGYGLGLSICKKLSELLKGDIHFESQLGKGSKFYLDIPMKNPSKDRIVSKFIDDIFYENIYLVHSNDEYLEFLSQLFKSLNVQNVQKFKTFPREIQDETMIIIEESLVPNNSEHILHILGEKKLTDEKNVKLPIKISKMLSQVTSKPSSPVEMNKSSILKEKKVLICEDNQVIHKSLVRMLKTHGIDHVYSAYNGLEALELCRKEFYDYIIMDISMPVMDGIEATKEIRKLEKIRKTKSIIICCTGNVFQSSIQKEKEVMVDTFLSKPISKTILIESLEKHL